MGRFEKLTDYIPKLASDEFGVWIIDRENDGTQEHPIQMPFVNYSSVVNSFTEDVYQLMAANGDMELDRYSDILCENGIEWSSRSMSNVDVSSLDQQCIMALIMGAVRAERFCDGALLGFFKDGCILKWLQRLKVIDDA